MDAHGLLRLVLDGHSDDVRRAGWGEGQADPVAGVRGIGAVREMHLEAGEREFHCLLHAVLVQTEYNRWFQCVNYQKLYFKNSLGYSYFPVGFDDPQLGAVLSLKVLLPAPIRGMISTFIYRQNQ